LNPNIGFERYVLQYERQRVVLFEVHAAFDRPVKFYGRAYVRVGSCKTELSKHPEKERQIWQRRTDWSALVCERATLNDLDADAIRRAKTEFVNKYPMKRTEVESWDDPTFLNKAGLSIHGGITHTAILLLGKLESSALLAPAPGRISWFLKDEQHVEKDYEHFGPPFIINVDRVLAKIRNLVCQALPSGTLFPVEIPQYDSWVLREGLHNCIAHQDYSLCGRINVVELPGRLILTNVGSFMPGSVEKVIRQDAPPEVYRNPFLAEIMVNLNMIDTQGGGIKKMYMTQAKRFFPMPDYDLSDTEKVSVSIGGAILDERYSRLLMEHTDLDLWTIVLLDKVQKRVRISREDHASLKSKRLVEGRYPSVFVAAKVAAVTGEQAKHIRNRGLDQDYYIHLVLELVRTYQPVGRSRIDELLMDKLPEVLSDKQKRCKIHNLLAKMSQRGLIENDGSRRRPRWKVKVASVDKS